MRRWRNDYADITLRNGEKFTLPIYGEPEDSPEAAYLDHKRYLIETAVNPLFTGVYAADDERSGEVMPPMLECLTLPEDEDPALMEPAVIWRKDISSIKLRMGVIEEENK